MTPSKGIAAVVLAAGYGKIAGKCKLMAHINGQPIIYHVLEMLNAALAWHKIYVVINYESGNSIAHTLSSFKNVSYVMQPRRCGPAGATLLALETLDPETHHVIITFGDMPMWRPETFQKLIRHHMTERPKLTMVTIPLVPGTRPERYGRILRSPDGKIIKTVEPWQIKPGEVVGASEVNPSLYMAEAVWLKEAISQLHPVDKGDGFPPELLLQDVIHVATGRGDHIAEVRVDELEQALGVNDEEELEEVRAIFQKRVAVEG